MVRDVKVFDVLISCPGDVLEEIEVIQDVFFKFNRMFQEDYGIILNPKHWKTDGYPESGDRPQPLLNSQIVDDCDAVIAIFWTRFGDPTDEYESGTQEEIEKLLEKEKQVFLYFSNIAKRPSEIDYDQYKKVLDFKEQYKSQGIYNSYNSISDFKEDLFRHLNSYFCKSKRITSQQDTCLSGNSNNNCIIEQNMNTDIAVDADDIDYDNGFLDHLVEIQENSGLLTEKASELTKNMNEFTSFLKEKTMRINEIKKTGGNTFLIRVEAAETARKMLEFINQYSAFKDAFRHSWGKIVSSYNGLLDSEIIFRGENFNSMITQIEDLKSVKPSLLALIDSQKDYRESLCNLRGLEKKLTYAANKLMDEIEDLIGILKGAGDSVDEIIAKFESIQPIK